MADTFYATLELKNIRMEGLLLSFLEKYEQNAIFCDRIWPKKTYEFSSQWHFKGWVLLFCLSLQDKYSLKIKIDTLGIN